MIGELWTSSIAYYEFYFVPLNVHVCYYCVICLLPIVLVCVDCWTSLSSVCIWKFPWQFADIDGAYFGTTFPHLFLMTYGHLKPQKAAQSYVPRVFGFKIHKPWPVDVQVGICIRFRLFSPFVVVCILPQAYIEIGMAHINEVKCRIP